MDKTSIDYVFWESSSNLSQNCLDEEPTTHAKDGYVYIYVNDNTHCCPSHLGATLEKSNSQTQYA